MNKDSWYQEFLKENYQEGLPVVLNHFNIVDLWYSGIGTPEQRSELTDQIGNAIVIGELQGIPRFKNPNARGWTSIPKEDWQDIRDHWFAGGQVRYDIHRDDYRRWLIQRGEWPVADDCILLYWWNPKTNADHGSSEFHESNQSTSKEGVFFHSAYWNPAQVIAWMFYRTPAAVDGQTSFALLAMNRNLVIEDQNDHTQINSQFYKTLGDAKNELLRSLVNGEVKAHGLKNNEGDLIEIPSVQWDGLRFYETESGVDSFTIYAGPDREGFLRPGATNWYGVRIAKKDILGLWPPDQDEAFHTIANTEPSREPDFYNKTDLDPKSKNIDREESKKLTEERHQHWADVVKFCQKGSNHIVRGNLSNMSECAARKLLKDNKPKLTDADPFYERYFSPCGGTGCAPACRIGA